ncbi:TadE/TadG family type IV pilus assembly protein [uncultured Aureimonas sp.]|uniref:TadE/TadG family type IV pilus assembly protein n=1 Tax=uncultured Aureimonas sp. TaxID=1604662 RepID=UPI002600E8F5|nr:TadE/TadG family type IV pilus assembly protein [uncultured Aureimonas sp.]
MSGGFRRDTRGNAAVEFALIAFPFFFLLLAMIETALATTAGVMLNNAVGSAARQVLTGAVQKSDMDADGFRKMICGNIDLLMSCDRLSLDMRTYPAGTPFSGPVSLRDGSVDDTSFCFDPGRQDTITVIRAYYEWPWTTSVLNQMTEKTNGNLILGAMAAFMNEPFGGAVSSKANC